MVGEERSQPRHHVREESRLPALMKVPNTGDSTHSSGDTRAQIAVHVVSVEEVNFPLTNQVAKA
jgi:hypothetical protein